MTLRRPLDELRLAMMMLTRLPMGRLADPAPTLTQARWAFPLVGLPLGLVAWAVFAGASALNLPGLTCAFATLAALAALTGGLHHDGFADFADGAGGRDQTQRLEIMRDSRVGSYGVIALIFAVGLAASALSALPASAGAGFVLVSVASRLAMLILLDTLPPARMDGLGHMAARARPQFPERLGAGSDRVFGGGSDTWPCGTCGADCHGVGDSIGGASGAAQPWRPDRRRAGRGTTDR